MKPFKVRIWSNKLNQFVLSNTLIPATNPVEFRVPPDCVVSHFTGLKDENGREVYEGDIFIQVGKSKHTLGQIMYYEVTWMEEEAGFGAEFLGTKEQAFKNYSTSGTRLRRIFGEHPWAKGFNKCVIIGNIFENPEFKHKEP